MQSTIRKFTHRRHMRYQNLGFIGHLSCSSTSCRGSGCRIFKSCRPAFFVLTERRAGGAALHSFKPDGSSASSLRVSPARGRQKYPRGRGYAKCSSSVRRPPSPRFLNCRIVATANLGALSSQWLESFLWSTRPAKAVLRRERSVFGLHRGRHARRTPRQRAIGRGTSF